MDEMMNRRKVLQAGGALIVAFSLPMARAETAAAEKPCRLIGSTASLLSHRMEG